MSLKFVALIRKEKDTDYWVDIPDLPGCVSSGTTEDEAKTHFEDALKLHLEALREEENFTLPEPRGRADVLSTEQDPYITDYIIEID